MATTFNYQPLNSERREIRLVDLAPDTTPSHIKLTTRHAALDELPRYYALSYTWGTPYDGLPPEWDDPNSTRTISLDGQNFEVRWNLYAALTVFCAAPTKYTTMWIDAICIDQSNIQERNSQVLLLGEIYKKAKITFVLLGPHSERFEVTDLIHFYLQPCDDPFQLFRLQAPYDSLRRLALFLECSWFRRTWVVQEVVLSPAVTLLTGNGPFAAWEELESLIMLFNQHLFSFVTACDFQESERPLLQSLSQTMKSSSYLQRSSAIRRALQDKRSFNLRQVLSGLQSFMVSDARDKVYGALGICSSCNFIKVDYNSSVSDVFVATIQVWLEKTGDLMILGLCQSSDLPNFPSWAVDFTAKTVPHPLGSFYVSDPSCTMFSAGGTGPANLRFDTSRTLIISGFQLGVLSFIGRKEAWYRYSGTCPPDIDTAMDTYKRPNEKHNFWILQRLWLEEWFRHEAQSGAKVDPSRKYLWTQEAALSAFARTLCADTEEHHDVFERFDKDWFWTEDGLSTIAFNYMVTNLSRHIFATTSLQNFCLVRNDVQLDDVVVIVTGAETPFLLHSNGDGTYAFKGFCYVHGFMDGEAFGSAESSVIDEKKTCSEFRIV